MADEEQRGGDQGRRGGRSQWVFSSGKTVPAIQVGAAEFNPQVTGPQKCAVTASRNPTPSTTNGSTVSSLHSTDVLLSGDYVPGASREGLHPHDTCHLLAARQGVPGAQGWQENDGWGQGQRQDTREVSGPSSAPLNTRPPTLVTQAVCPSWEMWTGASP